MQDTSREGDKKMAYEDKVPDITEGIGPYEALDKLLRAVGNLSMNYITDRPPLHKAVNDGHKVMDDGVREGRYVPQG